MNDNDSSMAANAICNAAAQASENIMQATYQYLRPSTVHKPKLFKDGNMWCALYGINLQEGVAGFGKSPEYAMIAFDKEWNMDI